MVRILWKKALKELRTIRLFEQSQGRQLISFWASKFFERKGIRRIFGIQLIAAAVFTGVITPEAENYLNRAVVETEVNQTPILAETLTTSTFTMPLENYRISQVFSRLHPAIDMTASEGTPVHAIEWGFVAYTGYSLFGYGNHVIISHDHHVNSLYGHLSEINVARGQQISRGSQIGKVGATGWATGNHLHLEIISGSTYVNPLELLPVKPQQIQYDTVTIEKTSSSSAELQPD